MSADMVLAVKATTGMVAWVQPPKSVTDFSWVPRMCWQAASPSHSGIALNIHQHQIVIFSDQPLDRLLTIFDRIDMVQPQCFEHGLGNDLVNEVVFPLAISDT